MPLSARSIFHQPALCHWQAAQSGSLACWLSLIKLTAGGLAAVSGIYLCPVIRKRCLGGCQPQPAEPCPDTTPLSASTCVLHDSSAEAWILLPSFPGTSCHKWHCFYSAVCSLSLVSFMPITALLPHVSFSSLGDDETEESLLSHTSPVYRKSELCLRSENTSLN